MRFLHPVFHVSLLDPHRANHIPRQILPPPLPIEIAGETEYEVSVVLDSRIHYRKLQYLVQWSGYENTAESTSWEPLDNVANSPALIAEFHLRYPNKP